MKSTVTFVRTTLGFESSNIPEGVKQQEHSRTSAKAPNLPFKITETPLYVFIDEQAVASKFLKVYFLDSN